MTENLICGLNMKGEGRGKKFSGMMVFKKFFEGRGGLSILYYQNGISRSAKKGGRGWIPSGPSRRVNL